MLSCTPKLPDAPKKLQAKLHQANKAGELNQVLQQCTNSNIRSSQNTRLWWSNSGAWLDAIPGSHHFTLINGNIVNAVCLRLGKAIPCLQSLDRCVAQCVQPIDVEGHHAMTCKWGGGPIKRHDNVLNCFYDMFKSLGFHCRKELTTQFENKQRSDIAIYNYRGGRSSF